MKLFILSGFETITYSTHTIFYASSIEKAHSLTLSFTKWLIENIHIVYHDTDEGFILTAFSNQLYYASSKTMKKSDIDEHKLFDELLKCIRTVEMDTLLFNESQTDGD